MQSLQKQEVPSSPHHDLPRFRVRRNGRIVRVLEVEGLFEEVPVDRSS